MPHAGTRQGAGPTERNVVAKITLIDDSSATLDLLAAILRGEGHSVQTLSSGAGAEAKLLEDTPDLVLLDVVMPERNGYEVLRALKRQSATKTVPVIMVSSKGEDTDIRWGLRQGAADYVTKPFTPETV